MFGGSLRWITGGAGRGRHRRRGWDVTAGGSNVPEFQARTDGRTALTAMASSNGWSLLEAMPRYDDGTAIDLSGGPFAPGRYSPIPPIVHGRAGYWTFWATSVSAMSRGAQWRPYALTFMQLGGSVPYLHVYPESWRASVTSLTPEVHLESGHFNDRFATFADDPRTVYGVLNPRAMQVLLDLPPVDELWTAGRFLCVSRVDPHHAEALGAHLHLLTTIAGGIPSSLFDHDR